MEKQKPRKNKQHRGESVDSDHNLTDSIRDSLKNLDLVNKRTDLENSRGSESEEGGNKVFGNELKIDEEDYKGKLRAANVTIIQLRRQLQEMEEQKNEQLTASKKLMQEKFEVYEKELEESNKTIKLLKDQIVKAKGEDVENSVDLKEKLLQSEKEVRRKTNELKMLKSQSKEQLQESEDVNQLRAQLQKTLVHFNEVSTELQAKNLEYTELNTKLTVLEQKLQEIKQVAMDDLQKALNEERQLKMENLRAKNRVNELEQKLEQTQNSLDVKTKQLLSLQYNTAEISYLHQQLVQSQSALKGVAQARDNVKDELAEANRHLKSLKSKEDELTSLRAQLQSYKSDFDAERQALQTEKDKNAKLSEELQLQQWNNQVLQGELDAMRMGTVYACPPQSCASSACYMPPPPVNLGYYTCPKCHNSFQNFSQCDIEYHLYSCMT